MCVYQFMAASILLQTGVNEVTHDAVPHVTCFTYTLTLQTHQQINSSVSVVTRDAPESEYIMWDSTDNAMETDIISTRSLSVLFAGEGR